ncbi:HpcH/HpaI aldolase/citrate lyase family protein [Rhodococcus jostii]|uniref:HpcH/HpaI aldolase/citrate lyase family protein n=1 Tax=Rhodococcus jostii TaxID=132919 RepID=UPI00364A7F7D
MVVRSLLFVPGGSPELLEKVSRCRPDAVVADLEDAVPPTEKSTARDATLAALRVQRPGAGEILLRINPAGSPWHDQDLAAATGGILEGLLDGIVLPKFDDLTQLDDVRAVLPRDARVVVGIESARGVANVNSLLGGKEHGLDAVYFGAEDLVADIGGRRSAGNLEVLYARSAVLLAAHLAGIPAIDQAVVSIRDVNAFNIDAAQGRDLGYQGKICLNPRQVDAAHSVFTPTPEELAHAREVVSAASTEGVSVLAGQMIDAVHVTMARAVLARGERKI